MVKKRAADALLPKIVDGQENKDLATPRLCISGSAMQERLRKRRAQPPLDINDEEVYPWNVISRMLLRGKPDETASRSDRRLWNVVMAQEWPSPPASKVAEGRLPCGACGAPVSAWCFCPGYSYEGCVIQELALFVRGVRDSHNPILHVRDPADQSDFADLFNRLFNSADCAAEGIVRLAYVAALTGKLDTVEAVGPKTIRNNVAQLRAALENMEAVHRGGQHPGCVTREQIADELPQFMACVGKAIATHFRKCQGDAQERQAALRAMVRLIRDAALPGNAEQVRGLGMYKAKKLAEMLVLTLLCRGRMMWFIEETDFNSLWGVWPIPENSRKALRQIFSCARSEDDVQRAMRTLGLACGSGRRGVNVVTLTAMLCFKQEHQAGVLNWCSVWL